MIDDHQNTVRDGDRRFLLPPSSRDAAILRRQRALLAFGCGKSGLNEEATSVGIAFAGFAGVAFPRTFMVAWAQANPGVVLQKLSEKRDGQEDSLLAQLRRPLQTGWK